MAKIYESQVEWQAPAGHRFQAAPLHDYISGALDNIAKQTDRASDGIQKLRDRDAADKMQKAGEAAQLYIDNFQDFSGDNYMDKMEAGAMKAWDEAFASLDTETQNRFMRNNPEARNIFNLKVHGAALDHTYDHENQEWTRQLPSIANEIVSLGDPNAIKKATQDWVYRLTEGTGMRPKDAENAADKLQAMVAQGAIAQAIGEGRVSDAAAINNDKQMTALLTPEQVARNNKAIASLIQEQSKVAKETDAEKILTDKMVGSFEQLYNDLFAGIDSMPSGEEKEALREQALRDFNKFLNDFAEGNLKDQYGGIPLAMITPEGIVLTDTPRSIRQRIVQETYNRTLENDFFDKKLKREIGFRAVDKAASLADDEGNIDVSAVKIEDMAEVASILDQVQGYYGFDDKVQAKINVLHQAYTEYLDMAETALQFSAFEDENTIIAERTGLGWRPERFARTGNITPATADALRSGAYKDTAQGTVFSDDYKKVMAAGIQNLAAWTNNGEMPESGTYREMLMQQTVDYAKMPLEDKKALGIENVTNRQIIKDMLTRFNYYDRAALLDSQVGDSKTGVRPVSAKATLESMSKGERGKIYDTMSSRGETADFFKKFAYDHYNLDPSVMRELFETNGALPDSTVGRGIVGVRYQDGARIEKKITKEQVDNINADWKEQIGRPVNAALAGDYAFRATKDKSSPVYKIAASVYGAPTTANAPQVPVAAAIQDTPYYTSFIDGIKGLNNGANPNTELVANYASANRSTAFGGSTGKARKADEKTRAYKVPYSASANKISVK